MDFQVFIDFARDGNFDHALSNVSNRVRDGLAWSLGFQNIGQVESNVMAHVSPVNTLVLQLDNSDGQLAFERADASFYNLLHSGLGVRVQVTAHGVTHTFTYFSQTVQETAGAYGLQIVSIECVCAMPRIQRAHYEPLVAENVTTSAALQTMIESAIVILPYTDSYFLIDSSEIDSSTLIFDPTTDAASLYDFESGFTTNEYVGDVMRPDRKGVDQQKAQLFISDQCIAEGFGRFFYQPRDMKFHYHNRYHDRLQAAKWTIQATDYIHAVPVSTPVYNEVRLHYYPRKVGSAGSTLFSADNLPITLNPLKERSFRIRYKDPNLEDNSVAALTVIDPEVTTDIIVLDSNNVDITRYAYISADLNATGGTLVFRNSDTRDATITKLQVRGTPITSYEEQISDAKDGSSMGRYNWLPLPDIQASYITDESLAQGICDFLIRRHKTMRRVFDSIVFRVHDDNYLDVVSCTVGDVVTVEEDWSGHNTEYVIVGEYHTYNISMGLYDVTWFLRSNDTTPYFIIDSSLIDGDDLIGY